MITSKTIFKRWHKQITASTVGGKKKKRATCKADFMSYLLRKASTLLVQVGLVSYVVLSRYCPVMVCLLSYLYNYSANSLRARPISHYICVPEISLCQTYNLFFGLFFEGCIETMLGEVSVLHQTNILEAYVHHQEDEDIY